MARPSSACSPSQLPSLSHLLCSTIGAPLPPRALALAMDPPPRCLRGPFSPSFFLSHRGNCSLELCRAAIHPLCRTNPPSQAPNRVPHALLSLPDLFPARTQSGAPKSVNNSCQPLPTTATARLRSRQAADLSRQAANPTRPTPMDLVPADQIQHNSSQSPPTSVNLLNLQKGQTCFGNQPVVLYCSKQNRFRYFFFYFSP